VAREPANQYNPLFLWGSVGLGKTHLMNAIANQFVVSHPDKAVLYTSTDEFISRLIEAIQSNTVTAFRNDFRSTDLLLIDDIQFLSGKERAQEEFFHIFNVLFQAGRQIVLTSDRPPRSISHLEDRLVSRFGAGVIVDIKPPGIETRMAIVKRETVNRGLNIDDEVLHLIVQRVDGSIRELKGAINQICATAEIGGDVVTIDLAQRVLDALYSPA
jgi:chromosomal replication initiator protein